jgi:thiol-disulfide isomerase/thioredoxin
MRRLVVNVVAMVALLAGFYLSARYYAEPVAAPAEISDGSLVGSLRPDFTLSSNTGEMVTPAIFSGKTVLLNFWATWCAPCRHEMPMLMDLQRQYAPKGLQVVGIALDDEQSVRNFVSTYGISYPILVGDADVFEVSAAYGNTEGVLPYSVLVDKDGIVRWQYAGKVRENDISNLLSEFL